MNADIDVDCLVEKRVSDPSITTYPLQLTPTSRESRLLCNAYSAIMSCAAVQDQAPAIRRRSIEKPALFASGLAVPQTMLEEHSEGNAAALDVEPVAASHSALRQRPWSAGQRAVAAAPRVIWGTSLVLMLTFIFLCQGGFLFGRADSEKVLSVHYICMSIAWPVRPTQLSSQTKASERYRSSALTLPRVSGACRLS